MGILQDLEDRKAYFQQLRDTQPDGYLNALQDQSAKLVQRVGVDQESFLRAMDKRERSSAKNAGQRHNQSIRFDKEKILQLQLLRYESGQSMIDLKVALVDALDKQYEILKDILNASSNRGGSSIVDRLFGGNKNKEGKRAGGGIGRPSTGGLIKAAAVLTSGVGIYNALASDKPAEEKAQGVANAAGGGAGALLGGAAGMKLGSIIGTFIAPGIGTAIGGAIGGAAGSLAGFFGGEAFTSSVGTALSNAVASSGLGTTIGRASAVIMSPFSAEARQALVQDYETNIIPGLANTLVPLTTALDIWGAKVTDYTDAFLEGAGDIWEGAKAGAGEIFKGAKNAFGRINAGFQSGGVGGAFDAAGAAVKGTYQQARSKVDEAFILAGKKVGAVSEKYESGGRGVGTISAGYGDAGGVSYGKYQLSSKTAGGGPGGMQAFLASKEGEKYAAQFSGLKAGSREFNQQYRNTVLRDKEGFEAAQHEYISRTHFAPAAQKLKDELGYDVSKSGRAVQEAVFSTAVQHGANSSVLVNALKGKDLSSMDDAQIISAIQDHKAANVQKQFKSSSPSVQNSVARRIQDEKATLLALNQVSQSTAAETDKPVSSSYGVMKTNATVSQSPVGKADVARYEAPVKPYTPPPAPRAQTTADQPQQTSRPTQVAAKQAKPRAQSAAPQLDEIPIFFPEMGMVNVLTGVT